MTVTVRTAEETELGALQSLLDESWRATYGPIVGMDAVDAVLDGRHAVGKLAADLKDDPELFLVADLGGEPVGHVFAMDRGTELYVDRLHVLATARRNGAARALMERVADIARERNIPKVRLEVMEVNAGAVRFYEALGYIATETRDCCGATLPSPSLMMEFPVPLDPEVHGHRHRGPGQS